MNIMSLNAWGGKLYDILLPFLQNAAPDVLCLQEVVHTPASSKDWLTYKDADHVLSQRTNLFRDICTTLPDHVGTFCPAAQGVLWNGDAAVASQWGLATFVHRSHPIIGQVQGFVHKDFGPDGYGDHPRSRSAHGVRIYNYAAARTMSVTDMHGLRDLRGKMDTPDRTTQAHRLLDMSHQVSKQGDLKVICGDFNVEPESETLGLLSAAGFTELVTSGGHTSTRTSHYTKPGRFADYMLINDLEAVVGFEVVTTPEVSDHCPLVLQI